MLYTQLDGDTSCITVNSAYASLLLRFKLNCSFSSTPADSTLNFTYWIDTSTVFPIIFTLSEVVKFKISIPVNWTLHQFIHDFVSFSDPVLAKTHHVVYCCRLINMNTSLYSK